MTHINDNDPNISVIGVEICSTKTNSGDDVKTVKLQYSKSIDRFFLLLLLLWVLKSFPAENIREILKIIGVAL